MKKKVLCTAMAVTIKVSHKRKLEQRMKSVPILVQVTGLEPA